ncbi:hypothetical protein JCM5350_008124 [Sporobolomyces pararoseus]
MSTKATGDDETSRIDHFSTLPYDVLDPIFELVYEEYLPTGPLSKGLFSSYEKSLYRTLDLMGLEQIEAFTARFRSRPHQGRLVEYLSVLVFEEEMEELEPWLDDPTRNPFVPLFALLPLLKHLNLTDCYEEVDLLRNALRHQNLLPNLRFLDLALLGGRDLSILDFLINLPSLTCLSIA